LTTAGWGCRVVEVEGTDVVCEVLVGGVVSDNKGLSVPGMDVSMPALSGKDVADLEFALGLVLQPHLGGVGSAGVVAAAGAGLVSASPA